MAIRSSPGPTAVVPLCGGLGRGDPKSTDAETSCIKWRTFDITSRLLIIPNTIKYYVKNCKDNVSTM